MLRVVQGKGRKVAVALPLDNPTSAQLFEENILLPSSIVLDLLAGEIRVVLFRGVMLGPQQIHITSPLEPVTIVLSKETPVVVADVGGKGESIENRDLFSPIVAGGIGNIRVADILSTIKDNGLVQDIDAVLP